MVPTRKPAWARRKWKGAAVAAPLLIPGARHASEGIHHSHRQQVHAELARGAGIAEVREPVPAELQPDRSRRGPHHPHSIGEFAAARRGAGARISLVESHAAEELAGATID